MCGFNVNRKKGIASHSLTLFVEHPYIRQIAGQSVEVEPVAYDKF